MTNIGIFAVIIDKFRHRKKPYSIILLKVNKNSEISFYYTILALSFVICLQVESNKKSMLDIKEIVQRSLDIRKKKNYMLGIMKYKKKL